MNNHCAFCKKPLGSRYRLTRIDATGADRGAVDTCSLICVIQWAYSYSISRGVQATEKVKDTIERLQKADPGTIARGVVEQLGKALVKALDS